MKKIFLIAATVLCVILLYITWVMFRSNTQDFGEKKFVFIPTGSNYDALLTNLKTNQVLKDAASFDQMARRIGLVDDIHPGKYEIRQGMGNFTMAKMLKGGKQVPVKLVINKLRTKKDIIRKICTQLEADSNELMSLLNDPSFLKQYDIDSNQIQCAVIPDTYQFYWNTDAKKAFEKIAKNYTKFWTDERKQKAKKVNMSRAQIITLASIVEEETNKEEDKLLIASTYINRLKKNMPLQADPTLKFAVNDFTLRRLLTVHTQFQSPYNTYLNAGLPPGPICTPAMSTIDAVLNAPATNYLYFCAKEDFKGYSNFAATYDEHKQNAKRYQEALNQRGIIK